MDFFTAAAILTFSLLMNGVNLILLLTVTLMLLYGLFVICGINLFLAAMIIVALPYLVTEVLDLEAAQANRLAIHKSGSYNCMLFYHYGVFNDFYRTQEIFLKNFR